MKISSLLKPHARLLALAFIAALGQAIADLSQPWPLKIVFDSVLKSRHTAGWLNTLVYSIAGSDSLSILRLAALAAVAIAAVGALCAYVQKYLTTSIGQWVMHELRLKLYSHIQGLSLAFHDHKQTGDLISRVTSDIDAIQSFITTGLLGALIDCLTLAGMIGVMLYVNWRFTLIALSIVPPLFLIIYSYTRRIKQASRAVRKKEGEMVSVIQEVLTSMRVVKAFGREEYEQRRLEEESLESIEVALRARSLKAKLSPLVEVIVAVGTAVVLWFGTRMVLQGGLSAGSLIVFIFYLGKMYKPMQDLSKMTDAYSKASVGYERIREVLETERGVKDSLRARRAPRFGGRIEFENVSFEYEPGRPVLREVSLAVGPGQLAALVGPTGAGKTTLVSLIPRLYDPCSGSVKIDGQDVRRFTQHSLRQQISLVLQETLLFHGSVWYNIAYGKPGATRREIVRAAELANASEFIDKMADGYDTIIGERGVTLSGGQRQRIAIARAVIRNEPILILDEPTTGLDAASERLVFEALDRLMKGKTCLVIAHRLSTVRGADVIFVVNDGRIVESGRHQELWSSGGLYAELCELQFGSEADSGIGPAGSSSKRHKSESSAMRSPMILE